METLTGHELSIKDDVLNTRYYSNYNNNKKEEKDDSVEAINNIEKHLHELKMNHTILAIQKGVNPDAMEEMHDDLRLEGHSAFEKFINDKSRFANKELIIEAYEGVLHEKRSREKEVLNGQRFKEYEKNRPP